MYSPSTEKPETASRLRGRIERVLNAAKAEGLRKGENPAQWRGHLDATLPKAAKLSRGRHAALPYAELPAFIDALRARPATAALALEFAILTTTRTGEVLGARFEEFDLAGGLWTIPASRMKNRREHRVPLATRALAIVRKMESARAGDFVFPGQRPTRPLSQTALLMLLRRVGKDVTAHGSRSAFADWASEVSHFSAELREAALAHTVPSKTEAAYRRGDVWERRRAMMEARGVYCEPKAANVVVFKRQS